MILVTGATGQIGMEVLRLLVDGGHRVRALVRNPSKLARLDSTVEVVQGDYLQADTLAPAFVGIEKAFLVAPAIDLARAAEHFSTAAARGGARHLVMVSSATISMEPPTTIGRWHLAAEERVKASGLAWTLLRPGNYASNSLRWAGSIRAQGAVFAPGGAGRTAPIDPRDIGAVAAKALTSPGHEGRTHVLSGPELLTPVEQVQKIGAAIGKALRFVDVPEAAARGGMLKAGMSEVLVDAILELIRAAATGHGAAVTSTVHDVTGVAARSFDEWVRDHSVAFT
jgi:uncharacterized protein YbjT (DUF2867 family)